MPTTIAINNNTPQPQCPTYVVIGGGSIIKYNGAQVANTGEGKYGYGWVAEGNSIVSLGYTSCTGIITKHDNGRITLAHIFPNGYNNAQKTAYKQWLIETVGGQLQGMWLVGGKDAQNANSFDSYKPAQFINNLVYIGPLKNVLHNFTSLDVLCTSTMITIRCRPVGYNNWSDGFVAQGAQFDNNFQNANGAPFLGTIRTKPF